MKYNLAAHVSVTQLVQTLGLEQRNEHFISLKLLVAREEYARMIP